MVWFRMDDSFPSHPKVLGIPRRDRLAAIGLWTLAGGWCAGHLTDGYLPKHLVEELGGTSRTASTLVEAGLWELHAGAAQASRERRADGFQFHDWADYNPTREEVKADREAARERMKRVRSREVRPNNKRTSAEVPPKFAGSSDQVREPRPDPSRPVVPDGTTSRGAKRATRIPDDWAISQELRDWATDQGYTPEFVVAENAKFVDYWRGIPGQKGTKLDWPGTWRNWIRRAVENQPRPRPADPVGRLERTLQRVAQRENNTLKELPG